MNHKDIVASLQEILGQKLDSEGYELDLVEIPTRGDRMVRLRTLEEALEEFDSPEHVRTAGYLIQVKARSDAGKKVVARTDSTSLVPKAAPEAMAAPAITPPPLPASALAVAEESIFSQLTRETMETAEADRDVIYQPDGKLNLEFLQKNVDLLFSAGEFALCRNILRVILKSGERSAEALFWIGRTFESENKLAEACKNYEQSVLYGPSLETYQRWSALLIRDHEDQKAAAVMERALSVRGLPVETVFELHQAAGNCWLRASNPAIAEMHYLKAMELIPNSDAVQTNLAALYLQTGRVADAKHWFEVVLNSNPRSDRALSGMGSCLLASGAKREAHDYFARSLEANLSNPTAIFYLVKCAYELKSYATAARLVGDFVKTAPFNANLHYSLAGLQFHLGRVVEARETLNQLLSLQPEHAGAKELMGILDKAEKNPSGN